MKLPQWLVWESKSTRARKEAAYKKKMFPLGEMQQPWEREMLLELFPREKKNIQMIHFVLLTLREVYANARLDEEHPDYQSLSEGMAIWDYKGVQRKIVGEEGLKIVQAMAALEDLATSPETLPTKEDIIARAELAQ